MANSVTARFNDDCKVFVSMSDDTTVNKAVIIDADGTETDIGGGGGDSDFSTAEVTIILSGILTSATVLVPNIIDSEEFSGSYSDASLIRDNPGVLTCVLYKGHAAFTSQYLISDTSGDVEADGSDAIISGDCSITLTA